MPPFLPNTLSGWLSLAVQLFFVVSAITAFNVRLIRKPLQEEAQRDREASERHLKEQGERMGSMAATVATNAARIEATDRVVERLHLTQTAMSERLGGQDTRVDRLLALQERHERERLTEDRTIGERLARIETRLDVQEDLKKIFAQLIPNNK